MIPFRTRVRASRTTWSCVHLFCICRCFATVLLRLSSFFSHKWFFSCTVVSRLVPTHLTMMIFRTRTTTFQVYQLCSVKRIRRLNTRGYYLFAIIDNRLALRSTFGLMRPATCNIHHQFNQSDWLTVTTVANFLSNVSLYIHLNDINCQPVKHDATVEGYRSSKEAGSIIGNWAKFDYYFNCNGGFRCRYIGEKRKCTFPCSAHRNCQHLYFSVCFWWFSLDA